MQGVASALFFIAGRSRRRRAHGHAHMPPAACWSCGAAHPPDCRYCEHCGKRLAYRSPLEQAATSIWKAPRKKGRVACCAACCCCSTALLIILCVGGFGVALPLLTSTRVELCSLGVNESASQSRYSSLTVGLAVRNPSVLDIAVSRAIASVVPGQHAAADVPLGESARRAVDSGALAACELRASTVLRSGVPAALPLDCAISRLSGATSRDLPLVCVCYSRHVQQVRVRV